MRFGTVSRNDRFHKVQVEIFQCVERGRSHATGSWPKVRSNKGKPEVAHHSYSRAQPRGWTARMMFKKLFYVLFYGSGQLFDRKRRHTTETAVGRTLVFKLCEKSTENATRSRVRLAKTGSMIPGSYVSNQSRPHSMATEVVRLPPMLNVRNFFAFSI